MKFTSQDASLIILLCVVSFFLGYALMPSDVELNLQLKKIGLQYSASSPSSAPLVDKDSAATSIDTIATTPDTLLYAVEDSVTTQPSTPSARKKSYSQFAPIPELVGMDSILIEHQRQNWDGGIDRRRQRILFIGDSMLEGLSLRMNDYATQDNNYLMTVIWYASGTRHWGQTDSLAMLIRKYKPTYIFISLGGNELYVKNVNRFVPYINNIIATCDTIPFVWIGPPNWREDTGINEAIHQAVGDGRYFDSKHLQLARSADHIHPTYTAAGYWMDSIARWVSSPQTDHPIQMTYPQKKGTKRNIRVFKRAR